MKEYLPEGIELTALHRKFRENPYEVLKDLRECAPVHEDTQLKQFVYTRHDDVRDILRDKDVWTDPRKANPGSLYSTFFQGDQGEEPSMLMMDEPGHKRLRSLVSKPFTASAIEQWRPEIRKIVQGVLDDISGDEFDLIAEFAGPIPTVVIAKMLGIDSSRHAEFKTWSDLSVKVAFNPGSTPEQLAAGESANQSLTSFFTEEIARRREMGGNDLISDMLRSEDSGERLSEAEIIRQCNLLLIAGNVTTTDLIGNCVKALMDHPAQLEKLRERPDLIVNAVEETLRFDSPVTDSGRIANRTITLKDCPVHRGDAMSTSLAAANRDPDVYPNPNKFDIEREDTHHQAFGGGRHTCLGAHLARLEAQEAINALLSRYPKLIHGRQGFTYASIPSFRGLENFWVEIG